MILGARRLVQIGHPAQCLSIEANALTVGCVSINLGGIHGALHCPLDCLKGCQCSLTTISTDVPRQSSSLSAPTGGGKTQRTSASPHPRCVAAQQAVAERDRAQQC